MISYTYVNGEHDSLILDTLESEFQESLYEINKNIDECLDTFIESSQKYMVESEILGESIDESKIIMESGNVFEKIGNAIIEMIKKIKDFFKKLFSNMSTFKNKTDVEKLSAAIKKNPDLSEELKRCYENGTLYLHDAKSISDIEKAYDEIIKVMKDQSIDPKSLKGRINSFKEKIASIDKKAAAVAGSGLVVGAGVVLKLRNDVNNAKNSANKNMEVSVNAMDKMAEVLDSMKNSSIDEVKKAASGEQGKVQLIRDVANFTNGRIDKIGKENAGFINKIGNKISSILKSDKAKVADIKAGKDMVTAASDLLNSKLDRKKREASELETSKKQASFNFDQEHPKEPINEREIAKLREQGKQDAIDEYLRNHPEASDAEKAKVRKAAELLSDLEFRRKYQRELNDSDESKSYASRWGSNNADLDHKQKYKNQYNKIDKQKATVQQKVRQNFNKNRRTGNNGRNNTK